MTNHRVNALMSGHAGSEKNMTPGDVAEVLHQHHVMLHQLEFKVRHSMQ